jgi:ABC-2 type transport system ATP-binding protein
MEDKTVVKIDHASKTFRLPHDKNQSIKSAVLNFYKSKQTYEKQKALEDVTFEIKEGEFFGIVGRNGSGKSTLLKLLAGIYSPSRGSITVNGKLTPFIELGVGFNPELTGRENVFLNGALLGFGRKEMNTMYDDIVSFAELKRFMDQKLKNYSSGMQVRLAFSIAIRARGDILLLDEVLAVGDAAFQQKCYDYFEELKTQKKTVVFVSHDMTAVRRFCTKAVYIKDGALFHEGSAPDIADIYVAENIDEPKPQKDDNNEPKLSRSHTLNDKITKQTDTSVVLEVTFNSKDEGEVYVGLSVIKDGLSIAEIVTPNDMKLSGKGKVSYVLDTTVFNAGVYRIDTALFRLKNRALLAVGNHESQFIIKGSDINRGAALKLANTWQRD